MNQIKKEEIIDMVKTVCSRMRVVSIPIESGYINIYYDDKIFMYQSFEKNEETGAEDVRTFVNILTHDPLTVFNSRYSNCREQRSTETTIHKKGEWENYLLALYERAKALLVADEEQEERDRGNEIVECFGKVKEIMNEIFHLKK
jgi:hypothetical protein